MISDYVTRFTLKTLKLGCISDELIQLAFHNGLQVGPLYDKLVRRPPAFSHEIWMTVCKYVVVKDSARKKTEQEANLGKTVEAKPREDKSRTVFDRINKEWMEPKVNSSQLAPLKKSRT